MNIFMKKTHEDKQLLPQNKLQRLAFMKGYRSSYEFAKAIDAAGIASYGTGFSKWETGKFGGTKYEILKGIAKFLGADTVEQVFDP